MCSRENIQPQLREKRISRAALVGYARGEVVFTV